MTDSDKNRAVPVSREVLDELQRDATRLDCLERAIAIEPLLLHNHCENNKGFLGLGIACTGRTLRQAIDDLAPFIAKVKP